jgi:histidine triad (HIT) family protein
MQVHPFPQCIFCRIIGGEEMVSVIYEDEEVIAFLDVQPLYPGHVLVAPKAHHRDLFSLSEPLAARTFATARRILPGLSSATGCRAVNIFSSNGEDGGQDVFHFHLHLMPVPQGATFPLQLPDPSAEIPSRTQLDVMAARIGRFLQEQDSVAVAAAAAAGV